MSKKDRQSNERMNQATNEANLQMNRETNAANMAINQANIDYSREAWKSEVEYNWDMFNAENEYNSASAQRQRLEEAGLNPYLMMNGGSAGTASGSSSPSHNQPSQIPMQPGHVDPYYRPLSTSAQDMQNLLGALGQLVGVQKQRAETVGIQMQNEYYRQRANAEIAQIIANTRGINESTKGRAIDNLFQQSTFSSRKMTADLQPTLIRGTVGKLYSDMQLNEVNRRAAAARLPYISQQMQSDIDLTLAKIKSEKSGQYLDYAAARSAVSSALLRDKERNNMPNLTKRQADELATIYVTNYREQGLLAKEQRYKTESERMGQDYINWSMESLPPNARFLLQLLAK